MTKVFEVIKISDKEKIAILNEMERLSKSGISFDDFTRIVGPKYFRKYTPKELQEAFWYFDKGIYLFINFNSSLLIYVLS